MEFAYAPPYAPAVDPLFSLGAVARNAMLEGVEQISPTEPFGDRLVIDVRQGYEVESMPLPDKDTQNIPIIELREKCKEIPEDKPLIAICSKGIRSAESVRILKEKGYSDVKYVGGGVIMKHPK
jgi:rhodanese-related sulfurtransferase